MFRRDFLPIIAVAFFLFFFPAKEVFAAMEVGGVPSAIAADQEIELTINLSGLSNNAVYYLKGSFYLTTNYFGLTWNGTSWVKNATSYNSQLAVTTDSQGSGSFKLKVKADPNDSGYQGPGSYSFKVARYTQAGSLSWSQALPITIGQPTNPSSPSQQPAAFLSLSEFMPNPDGGNEWAEVYNPLDFEIDIGGWKIDDIEGASSPYTIPASTKIGLRSFLVFSFSAKLNDSGDSIRLLNPSGTVVENYSYKETIKGDSFAKDAQGTWQITTTPTPGAPNKITLPSSSKTTSAKASAAKGTTNSQTNAKAADGFSSSSGSADLSLNSNPPENGQVAGAASQKQGNNQLAILLVAAGFSFLFAAAAWPAVEKRLWKKTQ